MELVMKEFAEEPLPEMTEIWNDVVEEGISFPGDKALSEKEALKMFREQASTSEGLPRRGNRAENGAPLLGERKGKGVSRAPV